MPADVARATESWRSRLDRWSFALVFGGLTALSIILLIAPTAVVLATSWTAGMSLRFPPEGFSLRWYEQLLTNSPEIEEAFEHSLWVAVQATLYATVLAVAAALAIARERSGWARGAEAAFMAPLTLPGLALGLGLLMLFSLAGIDGSLVTLAIGHTAIIAPYVLRTTAATLQQLDGRLLDSARSLGAGEGFAFRSVVLPLIAGAIAAGAFIGFMASFDNVAVSLFLSGAANDMLPLRLWNIIENLLDVRAAAASGLLILFTAVALVVMEQRTRLTRHIQR
ncbi:MAG: ABC transporter permease subunit [Alphaproteobacteria bacterium]|nr:ABC transporter permease subunit [Alphaproteobacteria bacterium]